jgi:dienelactone hydrolase
VRFDALARSVSRSTPVRADSVAVTQGCRGGLDPSACSAPAATSRLGRGHRCFPAYQPRSCAHSYYKPFGLQSVKKRARLQHQYRTFGIHGPLGGAASRLDAALEKAGVTHDVKEYPAASHAFLNDTEAGPRALRPLLRVAGIGPEPESAKDAWNRIELFFATPPQLTIFALIR